MAKKMTSQTETLRMELELADNGIILRNPDCVDDVTLAIDEDIIRRSGYEAIGKKLLDWLINVVFEEHCSEFVVTGFDIKIDAKCVGRTF